MFTDPVATDKMFGKFFLFFLCVCVWGYVYVTIGQPHLVHVTVAEHSD